MGDVTPRTAATSINVFPDLEVLGVVKQTNARNNLTATAGGGQANAQLLSSAVTHFSTVATAADSAKLPPAADNMVGAEVEVINAAAANSMNVFPSPGDSINALAADAAFAVAANKRASFRCTAKGKWHAILSA